MVLLTTTVLGLVLRFTYPSYILSCIKDLVNAILEKNDLVSEFEKIFAYLTAILNSKKYREGEKCQVLAMTGKVCKRCFAECFFSYMYRVL